MNLFEAIMPAWAARRAQARFETAQFSAACRMMESVPTFAKDDDEDEWRVIGDDVMPYTETDLRTLQDNARKMYYTDPCARGVIDTLVNFIIGKNATVEALDEADEVQAYWDEWVEFNNWDQRFKELVRRTLRDGASFLRMFPAVGNGHIPVRFINPAEIQNPNGAGGFGNHTYGIECDPDDIEKPLYYYRCFTKNSAAQWERIPAEEIIHTKILADSDMKRGISFLIGIAAYLKKYKQWLEDRITLNRVRSFFNVIMKPTGANAAATIKEKFSDVSGKTPTGGEAKKRLPKSGSVLIAKGVDYEFANLNINATDTKDDGRAIELMICKGTCLTEYVVRGDASNAAYASTMVAESPMVRSFEYWQDFFEKVVFTLFKIVITHGIVQGRLPATSTKTTDGVSDTGQPQSTTEEVPTSTKCQVNFATLIHRDIKTETEAYVLHDTQAYASKETISAQLGYDYKEEKAKIDEQSRQEEEKAKAAAENYDLQHPGEAGNQPLPGQEGGGQQQIGE